ncbi:MAG: metallopeptidase TldD-related protein [Acidobacteriota bacterium]
MKFSRREFAALLAAARALSAQGSANGEANDEILQALLEELERSKGLKLPNLPSPYFIEYALDDTYSYSVSCVLGALIAANSAKARLPRVQLRVGSAEFDNTNYVYSQFFGGRMSSGRIPLEAGPVVMRREFWLATDRAYKGAVQAVARKRAALQNVTQQEKLNDFAKAEPVRYIEPKQTVQIDEPAWKERTRHISTVFSRFPGVLNSGVEFSAGFSTSYLANTDGATFRISDNLFTLRLRADSQASDGMPIHDAVVYAARNLADLPAEDAMAKGAEEVAANVTALLKAPAAEDYSGPVLFEGIASPQLFAQLLGAQLAPVRKPVSEPGRAVPMSSSELEGRMGSRILPEWMDAVDDPTQSAYKGHPLFGSYPVDAEGIKPTPLKVIEKGSLKHFLLSRTPIRGFEGSNGRARLPGPFGGSIATFSNLFVKASETASREELRKKLIDMIQQRSKPFGLIIRKLDLPVTASSQELRTLAQAAGQRGGGTVVSLPTLVYKIFPDGREELVRGLRFRGVNARSLRDIFAAGDDEVIFDYIGQGGTLASLSPSGYVTTHTICTPSILFEDLELEKRTDDWPKLPLVPPPTLTSKL